MNWGSTPNLQTGPVKRTSTTAIAVASTTKSSYTGAEEHQANPPPTNTIATPSRPSYHLRTTAGTTCAGREPESTAATTAERPQMRAGDPHANNALDARPQQQGSSALPRVGTRQQSPSACGGTRASPLSLPELLCCPRHQQAPRAARSDDPRTVRCIPRNRRTRQA